MYFNTYVSSNYISELHEEDDLILSEDFYVYNLMQD